MQVHNAGCYAVVFASQRSDADSEGYAEMAAHMVALAQGRPGFLGLDSARSPNGFGITVSYWTTLEDIAAWRSDAEHLVAQAQGKSTWYARFSMHICRVERAYGWPRG